MARGMFQQTAAGGVWFVRKVIPTHLRPHFGGRTAFVRTTGHTAYAEAEKVADRLWREWTAEIQRAGALGAGPVADLPALLEALENWREARCGVAAGFALEVAEELREADRAAFQPVMARMVRRGVAGYMRGLPPEPPEPEAPEEDVEPFSRGALVWARAFFADDRNAGKPQSPGLPLATGVLMGRLQLASRTPAGWMEIAGFDQALEKSADEGGLKAVIPTGVREAARQRYARAWLEVVQHEEAERRRAAVILSAREIANASPDSVQVESRPNYVPREGDMTVGEVIDAFKAAKVAEDRAKPAGRARESERLLEKQYGHIFKALKELIGAEKPIRSVTRTDVRDLRQLLFTLPKNASKLYKGVPLVEASALAARDSRPTLAQNTVRSYMIALKGVFTFARDEEWVDANPVDGIVPSKSDETKRAALTEEQLTKVFGALGEERRRDSAHWWVPAVLAFTGARANEICQLHVDDIKTTGDVSYIDLSTFDSSGNRLDRRRLKTEASERAIPIHSELKAAGFLDFVGRRRAEGATQLFPELTENVLGYYSHEVSRVWGRRLDDCGLTDPALTLHSLRHGFKDAGDAVELPEYILEALGGWGSGGSAMRKYGGRCSPARVVENSRHLERVTFGGFTLGPPPPLAA